MRRKQEKDRIQVTSGENKRKHLEFIQAIVTRMAGNLFFLKGWAITLIAGLFALAAKDAKPRFYFVAYASRRYFMDARWLLLAPGETVSLSVRLRQANR
jgi:hypothetical protein